MKLEIELNSGNAEQDALKSNWINYIARNDLYISNAFSAEDGIGTMILNLYLRKLYESPKVLG